MDDGKVLATLRTDSGSVVQLVKKKVQVVEGVAETAVQYSLVQWKKTGKQKAEVNTIELWKHELLELMVALVKEKEMLK